MQLNLQTCKSISSCSIEFLVLLVSCQLLLFNYNNVETRDFSTYTCRFLNEINFTYWASLFLLSFQKNAQRQQLHIHAVIGSDLQKYFKISVWKMSWRYTLYCVLCCGPGQRRGYGLIIRNLGLRGITSGFYSWF